MTTAEKVVLVVCTLLVLGDLISGVRDLYRAERRRAQYAARCAAWCGSDRARLDQDGACLCP